MSPALCFTEEPYEMENSEEKINKSEIEAEPPKIVKHIKWFWLYGKDNKLIVFIFIIVILLLFFKNDIINLITKKDISLSSKIENVDQNQPSMDTIPDVTSAKREVLIESKKQLIPTTTLIDVSDNSVGKGLLVPGYFLLTASPTSHIPERFLRNPYF